MKMNTKSSKNVNSDELQQKSVVKKLKLDIDEQEKFYIYENKGYMDKLNMYVGVKKDHIAFRYEIIELLGKGAYGICYLVYDHKLKIKCALKIIRNDKKIRKQAIKEKDILKTLLDNYDPDENCFIRMLDYIEYNGYPIITFELLKDDLYKLICKNKFNGFSQFDIHSCTTDILKCLEKLYEQNIVHTDLKPENILLNKDSNGIKIIDFGSSCFIKKEEEVKTYIQSRLYRSPEIVLGCGYNCSIDMWSLGCIMCELNTGQPLFPARSEKHLINMIYELIGEPPKEFLATARRADNFFVKGKPILFNPNSIIPQKMRMRTISQVCVTKNPLFIDFISNCLTWDPKKRMTPTQALQHPYITKQKQTISRPVPRSDDTYEEEREFPLLP